MHRDFSAWGVFDGIIDQVDKNSFYLAVIRHDFGEITRGGRGKFYLFFFKNQKTVISVAQARGVAIVVCETLKLPIFEYTPLQVKQALTGYGRADKNQVQAMVKAICKLKEIPKPDDVADALATAICHAQTNRDLKVC